MPGLPYDLGKAPAFIFKEDETPTKVGVSLGIFFVSLFAVSFPSLTKRSKRLRVPSIVFFLGKHFGTGVILSTAFVHLLPDAFGKFRSRWTGFIILGSLLSIFFVEYITTAYVDYLHSYPSAPPSPTSSPSRSPSPCCRHQTPSTPGVVREADGDSGFGVDISANEHTPLLVTTVPPETAVAQERTDAVPVFDLNASATSQRSQAHSHHHPHATRVHGEDEIFAGSHHRHEPREVHVSHTVAKGVGKKVAAVVLYDEDALGEVPNTVGRKHQHHLSHSHSHSSSHSHSHHGHRHAHMDIENWNPDIESSSGEDCETDDCDEEKEEVKVGRRRQIVGILMLQIGIMLHSLVIGLTLSVSIGSEFTSLVTAILFHQLFEGLSLGIRIAGLPSPPKQSATRLSRLLQPCLAISFALTTPLGMWIGLGVFGSTKSPPAGTDPHSPLTQTQSMLSALSAGMLIYAACVEMLAGDFVMDPTMWRSSLRRQVMALIAVAVGVASMGMVG